MPLPRTGTNALLELLSPYIPDEAIGAAVPRHRGSGRRTEWSAGQLYRVLLLLLLTPARSANLLCALLPEQRAWRRFAHLPNQRRLPNVRQLHEFRGRLTPGVLRGINAILLQRVLASWPSEQAGIGLIDATDLPAATQDIKKVDGPVLGAAGDPRRPHEEDRAGALFHRVQKAHAAALAGAL
jgi:hypothetical protein